MDAVVLPKWTHLFWVSLIFLWGAFAHEAGANGPSEKNIKQALKEFTAEPHVMGTLAQRRYVAKLEQLLKSFSLKVQTQVSTESVPRLSSRFLKEHPQGGRDAFRASDIVFESLALRNVWAWRPGTDNCAILLGSHTDTKHIPGIRLVGANDGGSSTALLLEVARVLSGSKKPLNRAKSEKQETIPKSQNPAVPKFYGDCDVIFAFFDGEEAGLPDWTDGNRILGLSDHLYGSRRWVRDWITPKLDVSFLKKKLELAIIFDMVGHKDQQLFLTQGSDAQVSHQLVQLSKKFRLKLQAVNFPVEDDHLPFMQKGIRAVHMIDWTNIEEWHTEKDDLSILSTEKITRLAALVLDWLTHEPNLLSGVD